MDRGTFGSEQVLSVSVEGALECHMRFNDVFCAVSLSGKTQSARLLQPLLCRSQRDPNRLGDLLFAHALGCRLLDGEKFLCRADHSSHANCL